MPLACRLRPLQWPTMTMPTALITAAALALALPGLAAAQTTTQTPIPTSPSADAAPLDPGAVFMAQNARKPGVVVLPSGLQYRVLKSGPATGVSPKMGDEVQVVYQGRLLNGTVFDATTDADPASLQVGELVPGWNEALQLMRPGDEWELYIPPNLGYGDEPKGPIPGGSTMIFRMTLVAVGPLQ
jgi:FKBP-type peptidyl-prolyl cis-trans isomerase